MIHFLFCHMINGLYTLYLNTSDRYSSCFFFVPSFVRLFAWRLLGHWTLETNFRSRFYHCRVKISIKLHAMTHSLKRENNRQSTVTVNLFCTLNIRQLVRSSSHHLCTLLILDSFFGNSSKVFKCFFPSHYFPNDLSPWV